MSIFGTDGIRGKVGVMPIEPQFFLRLGLALGHFAEQKRILIAKDTRLSGYMLESALCAGLTAAGSDVFLTGPLPTPALAYLTQSLNAELGIMISASHNLYHDNGVKIFYQGAHKLSDEQQQALESLLESAVSVAATQGKIYRLHDASGRYIEFLKRHVLSLNLKNKIVILDCAHGAAYKIAPQIFEEFNATVKILHAEPNGLNINEKSGVTDLDTLEQYLTENQSDYAIAFDGDADRVILYIQGKRCDPHYMLLMLHELYQRRTQKAPGIIGTQIHNQGLVEYCKKTQIPWIEVPVGDRHLIAAARETGLKIAGEPSGHYILMDLLPTADGLLTALLIIEEIELGCAKSLDWFEQYVPLYPCFSYTLPVDNPKEIVADVPVQLCIQSWKNQYPLCKILVRPSGTEPVIRLYIEGMVLKEQAQELLQQLQCALQSAIAAKFQTQGVYFEKKLDSQLEASLG